MKSNYWINFWKEYGSESKNKDSQTQVLRCFDKKPIDNEMWEKTLFFIEEKLGLQTNDIVLDLCCGNGLISKKVSKKCKAVTAIDISFDLIENVDINEYPNITPIAKDIRDVDFEEESFDKVLIYAGLQYLTEAETIELFEKVYRWLKPEGVFYIGDIPDKDNRWTFFNNAEREAVFFSNLKAGKAIIGTWFDKIFLKKLCDYVGFSKNEIIPQEQYMIYAKFRYDMLLVK